MSDQPPAAKPSKSAAAPSKAPSGRKAFFPRGLGRVTREIGPYALALGVFVVTAHSTLNTTAAHYADELFTLALVLIRTGGHAPPPAKP